MSAAFRTSPEKLAKQTKLKPKVVMSHRAVGMFFLLLIISRWEIEQPGEDPGERLLEHLLLILFLPLLLVGVRGYLPPHLIILLHRGDLLLSPVVVSTLVLASPLEVASSSSSYSYSPHSTPASWGC